MNSLLITEEQRSNDRLMALADIYQGMDRIITGDKVSVNITDEAHTLAPAWSNGSTIYFNRSLITGTDIEHIARVHGLNVHELAHVLFTPRKGTSFMTEVVDRGLTATSNILEDQRIETLLTATYPSTRHWLQATVGRWIISQPGAQMESAYVLLRGRRYLPGALRGAARALWPAKELLPRIDEIIDEYRLLAYPADYARGIELIAEFDEILKQAALTFPPDPYGHGSRPEETLSHGRPRPVSEQRRARDRADDGEPEQSPSDGASDADADAGSDDSASGTGTGEDSSDLSDLVSQAADMLDEVMSRQDVHDEIVRAQRQILGRSAGDEIGEAKRVEYIEPDPQYKALSQRFRKVLEALVRQADPGWISREASGRVNPMRWVQEQSIESAFDRWDDGVHDSLDLEVVILLDESGSMGNDILQATNAMWATKRALDRIEASTTVLCFSTESRTLYRSSEKASHQIRYVYRGGGTNPVDSLRQAAEIFEYSHRSQKILIVFTDGDWHEGLDNFKVSSEEYIKRMNRNGVVTALGYIVGFPDESVLNDDVQYASHGCTVHSKVGPDSLVRFIQSIVTTSIRQRLSRR